MNEEQMRAELSDGEIAELVRSLKHNQTAYGWVNRQNQKAAEAIEQLQAALASQAKSVPIGYIDREQLTRWEKLRGTEFEREERAYIGFSTKPFKSEMSDCTLAVYASPQPIDESVLELDWKPSEEELLEYARKEELYLFADEGDYLAIANGVLELVQIKINQAARRVPFQLGNEKGSE